MVQGRKVKKLCVKTFAVYGMPLEICNEILLVMWQNLCEFPKPAKTVKL